MIKVENKTLELEGTPHEILVETMCIINAIYLRFVDAIGEECARYIFDSIIPSAYMTKEEMEEEIFGRMME